MPQRSCCGVKVVVDAQASCRHRAGVVALIVMVSLSSMCRHLCRCRDGVIALVVMASLPLLMHRRLAIVDNDGDGAAGDDGDKVDDNGATGDDDNNDRDGASDDKVDDGDVDGAMNDDINNECDGAMGNNDNDNNSATDDNVDGNGNSAMDDDVDDDDGDRTTDLDRTKDDDIDDDGYGARDNDNDNNCNNVTDSCHRLDVFGSCTMKGDARRRHATTGNATTSRLTRCKREERHQRTRGDRALIGQGCGLRGRGKVKRMRGKGIDLPTRNGSPSWRSRRLMQRNRATLRWLI